MLKVLGGVVVGVFVGAVVFEILHRRNPNLLKGIEDRARRTARAAADAFDDGYRSPKEARVAAEAD